MRNFDGRWLAVAEISGEYEVRIGTGARLALTDALTSLGPDATALLLADAQLNGIEDHC
jgi:hypothetical protein